MQKAILSKKFVAGQWTAYEMTLQIVGHGILSLKRPVLLGDADTELSGSGAGRGYLPPLMMEKVHFLNPVCVETSHFESNVDKLGRSQKTCETMIKRLRNMDPGIVKQLSLKVKI